MTSALWGGKRVKPNLELAEGGGGLDQMLTTVPYIFTERLRRFLLHNLPALASDRD